LGTRSLIESRRGADHCPPPGSVRVLRLTLIAIALASAMGAWSCDRGDAASARRPRDATDAIRQVRLRQTTPGGLAQRFGVADERSADGSLEYRFETTRQRTGRAETVEETVTFRFANGRLTKICRTRS